MIKYDDDRMDTALNMNNLNEIIFLHTMHHVMEATSVWSLSHLLHLLLRLKV